MPHKSVGIAALNAEVERLSSSRKPVEGCPHCNFRSPEVLQQATENARIDSTINLLYLCISALET